MAFVLPTQGEELVQVDENNALSKLNSQSFNTTETI